MQNTLQKHQCHPHYNLCHLVTKFGISQLHSPSPGEANSDWWAEEDLLVIHYTGTKNGISSSISWLESNRKFQYYKMKISKSLKSKKKYF